jgi:hypothetical protein
LIPKRSSESRNPNDADAEAGLFISHALGDEACQIFDKGSVMIAGQWRNLSTLCRSCLLYRCHVGQLSNGLGGVVFMQVRISLTDGRAIMANDHLRERV